MFAFLSLFFATVATVDARQVQSGEYRRQIVSVEGTVIAVTQDDLDSDYNWIVLGTPTGKIYAASHKDRWPYAELLKLTDAEIRLTGIVGQFTSWRRFLGHQLTFDRMPECGLTVLKPAPADPFEVPDLRRTNDLHRRKAQGVVIAVARRRFFLRSDAGTILCVIPAKGERLPEVGSTITVSAFPNFGQRTNQMDNARWRLDHPPSGDLESAEPVAVRSLFVNEGGRRYIDSHLCGRIIELTGIVTSLADADDVTPDAIQLNCEGANVRVELGGIRASLGELPKIGDKVRVSGLCYGDFNEGVDGFPRLEGFTLIPRTGRDFRVVSVKPWFMPKVLLWVIGLLTAALGLCVGWVASLRIVSARRARELAQEQVRGARAELKVEERTRLAVELHDSLSQTLTGVALQIDAAAGADPELARGFLSTARNMLSSCRQELNGCLWDLRSRTFEEKDMTEAVQRTLAPHVGSAKLTVRFNVPRERISEQTAHAVLRIIRELGTNAVKHGHAKTIKIAGEFHDDIISFSVLDDGVGFDAKTAPGPVQGHFGLQGVRERLNGFNGTLRCDSEPGCGAKFTVTLHTLPDKTI